MGVASKAGDWAFKAFTAGLGVTTIYLAATFSVNVYRDLSLHNAQSPAKPGTPISKFILRIDYTSTKLSLHEAVHNILYRHEGELAAAASQPLPDDDDDAFD